MRTASQLFFSTGLCEKETEAGRDVFFGEKYLEIPHNRGAGGLTATAFRRTATRSALHFGAPGARHGKVLIDARPGRSRHRVLPALGQSAQARPRCRRRPGAPSEGNGHHGAVVLLHCFLLLPYHHVLHSRCLQRPASHVEGVVQARKKKSVGSWFVAESAPLGGEL